MVSYLRYSGRTSSFCLLLCTNVWMDAPWGHQRVKREHSTDDNSPFKAVSRGGLALPRGSFGDGSGGKGVSRNPAAKNTGSKNKRRRSAAAVEGKVRSFSLEFGFFFQ